LTLHTGERIPFWRIDDWAGMISERGFTVVEFFVSLFLTLIMMGVVYSVYRLQTRTLKVQEKRLDAQQYIRAILSLMVREVRNAGHFPVGATGCPAMHTLGIVEADKQEFQFVYDSDDDENCTDPDEYIRYSFSVSGCPSGYGNIMRQDLSSNPASPPPPITLTDCNVPAAADKFFFAYYGKDKGDGEDYATPVAAGELANIQRVFVKAAVESKNTDVEFGGPRTVEMSSSVNLRNRGLPP